MNLNLSHKKCIVFDLDGTFYSLFGFSWLFVLVNLGFLPYARDIQKYQKARKQLSGVEFPNSKEHSINLCIDMYQSSSIGYQNKLAELKRNVFFPAFIKALRYKKARPKLNLLLKELSERGISLVVFSDYGHIIERLEALKIESKYFDFVIAGEEIGAQKPAIKGLLNIAKKLGLRNEEILYIGDLPDMDGVCAHNAKVDYINCSNSIFSRNNRLVKNELSWGEIHDLLME